METEKDLIENRKAVNECNKILREIDSEILKKLGIQR
jgi:hypothetical protein